jgi:glycosyltransferase involved in cell wall biosynthesis
MKLLIFITDITHDGGTERITVSVANEFIRNGHDVTILSAFRRNPKLYYNPLPSVKIKYLVDEDYNLEKQGLFQRIRGLMKALFRVRSLLKEEECDVVLCVAFLPAFLLYLSGRSRQKTYAWEHFKYELYGRAVIGVRNYMYSKFRGVITLTNTDRDKFLAKGIRAVTIHNMSSFPLQSRVAKGVADSRKILAIGRLEDQKGFDLLQISWEKVVKRLSDWKLEIFGQGNKRDELLRQRHELGLDGSVDFKGYSSSIPWDDYAFMVVSSRFEGFSLVIVEALSNGLPVVSFDCPEGPGMLLANGVGILIEPENTEALSEGIIKMATDREQRIIYAEKSLERAMEFTPEVIYKKWLALFQDG